jgi:phosphate transport system protein
MEHTLKAVDEELSALTAEVAGMGEQTVRQVRAALSAFARHDPHAAALVVQGDAVLDEMDADIERRSVRFIALRQPMADDLRAPITAMKTAMNLERCGDLAKNIAKRVSQVPPSSAAAYSKALAELGELAAERLGAVVKAYGAGDAEAAKSVWENDTEIDAMEETVFRNILGGMEAGPSSVEGGAHLLFIAKNLERIGDHATNIAELVWYQSTGEDLSDRPKGEGRV